MHFPKELFLKTPFNKPPFIGISYPEYAASFAQKDNQDLPTIRAAFSLYIRPEVDILSLRLEIEGMYNLRGYSDIKYDSQELKKWLSVVKDSTRINFGHVYKKGSEYKAVKTFSDNRLFVIPIKRLYIMADKNDKIVKIIRD